MAAAENGIDGIVFGRQDFSMSQEPSRDSINSAQVTACCVKTAEVCKTRGLDLVVGGAVSIEALPSLRAIYATHLTRFETRKIIFAAEALNLKNINQCILTAIKFEYLWLNNKRNYYIRLEEDDLSRIDMLEKRLKSVNVLN